MTEGQELEQLTDAAERWSDIAPLLEMWYRERNCTQRDEQRLRHTEEDLVRACRQWFDY